MPIPEILLNEVSSNPMRDEMFLPLFEDTNNQHIHIFQ